MKKGFTLIEVLTVVLIIAVLTAVATPQYRRVVERARATEAISMLRSLYDSSERLAGEFGARNYPEMIQGDLLEKAGISRLDVIEQDTPGYAFRCNILENGYAMVCPKDDQKWNFILWEQHPGSGGDRTHGGRYIVALRLAGKEGKNAYAGTQLVFDRETETLFCVPDSEDTTARACDVYNVDVGSLED